MKHLLTLVGITAVLVSSASAQLNATTRATGKSTQSREDARIARALNSGGSVYYICSAPQTGSHIPQVIARTKEYTYTINASGHGSSHGTTRNGLGGSSSVSGALAATDPAITTSH